MTDRLATYIAALVAEWLGGRSGGAYVLREAMAGDAPVYLAAGDAGTTAIAVARVWEPETDAVADAARAAMEERLDAGSVRGAHLLWAPPRAAVPADEPVASDFVLRTQLAAAPLLAGGRAEVELPVALQLAKLRDEGGYASVIGGLSRWWTAITERVDGTFHVNSAPMRRAPRDEAARTALFDRIGELSRTLATGEALEFDAAEAWTVQRLSGEPLGETGFAIAQAPPRVDPGEGALQRRLLRKRLKEANDALDGVEADLKGVALIAIFDYAENENTGSFVKSFDPALYSRLGFVATVADGEVRPIFSPR